MVNIKHNMRKKLQTLCSVMCVMWLTLQQLICICNDKQQRPKRYTKQQRTLLKNTCTPLEYSFPCLFLGCCVSLSQECKKGCLKNTQLMYGEHSIYNYSMENLMTTAYQNILLLLPASPSLLLADESTPQFFVQLLLDPENKLQQLTNALSCPWNVPL